MELNGMTEEQILTQQFLILQKLSDLKNNKITKTTPVKSSLSDFLGVDSMVGLQEKSPFDGTRRGSLKHYLTEVNFPKVGDERYVKAGSRSSILNFNNRNNTIRVGTNLVDSNKGIYVVKRTS